MITCHELTRLITDYLEGTMPETQQMQFRAHVRACPPCQRYLSQMQLTVKSVGRLPQVEPPPPVRDALLDAFRGWRAQ